MPSSADMKFVPDKSDKESKLKALEKMRADFEKKRITDKLTAGATEEEMRDLGVLPRKRGM